MMKEWLKDVVSNWEDLLLHVPLILLVTLLAYIWPPLAGAAALYLREQGQARSWVLNMHKTNEWVLPGIVAALIYIGIKHGLQI